VSAAPVLSITPMLCLNRFLGVNKLKIKRALNKVPNQNADIMVYY